MSLCLFTWQRNDNRSNQRGQMSCNGCSAHRGRTEDVSFQFPLAVDVVLGDLHLETSRLSIEQLHAINRTNNLDVTSWWFKEKQFDYFK